MVTSRAPDLVLGEIFVVLGKSGEVEMASDEGLRWLEEEGVRPSLRAAALRARTEGSPRTSARARTARGALLPVELVRLVGRVGESFLVVPLAASANGERGAKHLLTPMQQQVSELLLTGATLSEIGELLGVSAETVKSHTKGIYLRLGVSTRVELARVLKP